MNNQPKYQLSLSGSLIDRQFRKSTTQEKSKFITIRSIQISNSNAGISQDQLTYSQNQPENQIQNSTMRIFYQRIGEGGPLFNQGYLNVARSQSDAFLPSFTPSQTIYRAQDNQRYKEDINYQSQNASPYEDRVNQNAQTIPLENIEELVLQDTYNDQLHFNYGASTDRSSQRREKYMFQSFMKQKDRKQIEIGDQNRTNETQIKIIRKKQDSLSIIPDEEEIRRNSIFKLPVLISRLENPAVSQHFLDNFPQSVQLVQDIINANSNNLKSMADESINLRREFQILRIQLEKQINELQQPLINQTREMERKLDQDFLTHQSELFQMNQEITKLSQDSLAIQDEIDRLMIRVDNIENQLYSVQVFNLETNDQNIVNMTHRNMRDDTVSPRFKQIYH